MALVWHEKASRTALQTSTVNYTHTLLVQTHTHMTFPPSGNEPPSLPLVRFIVEYSEQGTGYTGNRILSTGYLNRGNFPYFQFQFSYVEFTYFLNIFHICINLDKMIIS